MVGATINTRRFGSHYAARPCLAVLNRNKKNSEQVGQQQNSKGWVQDLRQPPFVFRCPSSVDISVGGSLALTVWLVRNGLSLWLAWRKEVGTTLDSTSCPLGCCCIGCKKLLKKHLNLHGTLHEGSEWLICRTRESSRLRFPQHERHLRKYVQTRTVHSNLMATALFPVPSNLSHQAGGVDLRPLRNPPRVIPLNLEGTRTASHRWDMFQACRHFVELNRSGAWLSNHQEQVGHLQSYQSMSPPYTAAEFEHLGCMSCSTVCWPQCDGQAGFAPLLKIRLSCQPRWEASPCKSGSKILKPPPSPAPAQEIL